MTDTPKRSQIVEKVVADLKERVTRFEAEADPRLIFTLIYKEITDRMLRELVNQETTPTRGFSDPRWLADLDRRFAECYLKALDTFDRNDPNTPRVWKAVFEAIGVRKSTIDSLSDSDVLRALLLSMVAHIMHDLVFALDDLKAAPANESDHEKVTDLLCEEIDNVQNTRAKFAPLLGLLDGASLRLDEILTCRVVKLMRQRAWNDAKTLRDAQNDEEKRAAIKKSVEEKTLSVINEIIPRLTSRMKLLDVLEALPGIISSS